MLICTIGENDSETRVFSGCFEGGFECHVISDRYSICHDLTAVGVVEVVQVEDLFNSLCVLFFQVFYIFSKF